MVTPFSRSIDREISGTKKVYFCDTGLLDHFVKVDAGSLFENSVFNNLRKYGRANYYQRRIGAEIDFVVDQKIGIEAKIRGTDSDLRNLVKVASSLGLEEAYVVTKEFNEAACFIPATEI